MHTYRHILPSQIVDYGVSGDDDDVTDDDDDDILNTPTLEPRSARARVFVPYTTNVIYFASSSVIDHHCGGIAFGVCALALYGHVKSVSSVRACVSVCVCFVCTAASCAR